MTIDNQDVNEEFSKQALEELENAENKSEAIVKIIQKAQEINNQKIIDQLKEEQERAVSDEQYAKDLNLRKLNAAEKKFYQKLVEGANQTITFTQDDVIPTSITDKTLEDIKTSSKLMELIEFAPANVNKWITGAYQGYASWHGITAELAGELEATINALNIDLSELDAYLVIPKALGDLALPFVDKFFRTVLKEALILGFEDGFLNGTGKEEPIGIYKKVDVTNGDGTHQDKAVNANFKKFTPKGMKEVKKYLSKNGKRTFGKLFVVCHPDDEADYVAPAIYNDRGDFVSSYKNIEVVTSIKNPQGKAAIVIPKRYTMGFNGFKVKKYDQTLALKNADVLVGTAYANGRADDDNVAFVFDVTKLEEYVPVVATKEYEEDASL